MAKRMLDTAKYLGLTNPWDALPNLRGGARYFREQLDRYGSWDFALTASNAGSGSVEDTRVFRLSGGGERLSNVRY